MNLLPACCMLGCDIIRFASNATLLPSCLGLQNRHVASQRRLQNTDLERQKLVKEGKRVWPALFRSLPNTKTNGQQGFLKIGEEPDFPK